MVSVNRRVILKLGLMLVRTDNATDLAGLFIMALEIMASGPQFYVLTRYVESSAARKGTNFHLTTKLGGCGILTLSILLQLGSAARTRPLYVR